MDITNFPDPTRESYLRTLFSQEQKFTHYGTDFHYVPKPLEEGETRNEIIGRIGRSVTMEENLSPSDNFEDSR